MTVVVDSDDWIAVAEVAASFTLAVVTAATDSLSFRRLSSILPFSPPAGSFNVMIDDGVEDVTVVVVDDVDVDTVILFPVVFSFVTDLRLFVFGIVAVIVLFVSMFVLLVLLLLLLFVPLPNDEGAKSAMRAVVGLRIVDVPQTLGCEVTNHGGLGRDVVVDD